MSEKKVNNKILASLLPVIVFVLYTVITFIVWGDDKESGFWLGWVFSLIATGITTAMPYIMTKKDKEVKSIIDGFSIYYVTLIYFIAQLVLGLFCMILNDGPMSLLVILELVLNGVYAFFVISSFMGINVFKGIEKKQKEKVYFVKSVAADITLVAGKVQDEDLKQKLEKLAEVARYSDPMSNPAISGLETSISTSVEDLKDFVSEGKSSEEISKIINKIEEKFAERNEKCKLLK